MYKNAAETVLDERLQSLPLLHLQYSNTTQTHRDYQFSLYEIQNSENTKTGHITKSTTQKIPKLSEIYFRDFSIFCQQRKNQTRTCRVAIAPMFSTGLAITRHKVCSYPNIRTRGAAGFDFNENMLVYEKQGPR